MLKALYDAIRNDSTPNIVTEGQRKYSDKKLYPMSLDEPEPLRVTSLDSVCDYIKTNVDKLCIENLLLTVDSPSHVTLYSDLQGPFSQRFRYLTASMIEIELPLEKYFPAEDFNVLIQATILNDFDKEKLLRYIANVKSVGEIGLYDDGTAQQVTVKKGISIVEKDVLPNPVTLAPFRTFLEIEQPESQFIFRIKEVNGTFHYLLKEADGGFWRNVAHQRIAEYLKNKLPDLQIIS